MSRTTREGPSGNQPDDGDCVVCGDPAGGIDARTRQPICRRCATIRADGGEDEFSIRVDEMVREIEDEVEDSTPAEAMLYARCSAAFEDAVNNTDLPSENALGVVTAALFEAADTVGYARSDVIETAREHYVDEDDVDRGDGPVTDGGCDVSAGRRRVTSSINFGGASGNHVATPGEDMNHLSGEVSIEVSGASTDYPHPTRLQREIEAVVADVLDDYAERVADDVDRGDGVETDGGRIPEGQPIDPLVCPRGHHSVDVDATRFGCETCRANDLEPARWDKSELVDLRSEEPPLADDSDERGRLVTDGGRSMTRRESERRARTLAAGMIEWANRAGVDAGDVLRHVRERVDDIEDDHDRTTHLHVGRDADGRPSAIYRDLDRGIDAVDSDSALHRHVERLSVDIPVVDDGLDFDDDRDDGDEEGEVIRA